MTGSTLSEAEWNMICRAAGKHTANACDALKVAVEAIVAARVAEAQAEAAQHLEVLWAEVQGWKERYNEAGAQALLDAAWEIEQKQGIDDGLEFWEQMRTSPLDRTVRWLRARAAALRPSEGSE